jgi:hypothetical protein
MNPKSLDKNKTNKATQSGKETWRRTKQTFPFSDQNMTVSFYAKTDFSLAQVQCNFEHREMTKWQLFKRLLFRIWHKK